MQYKPSVFTILLWVALAGLCVGVIVMAPGTVDAYVTLAREQQATPTPTANTGSVLMVTADPANTPTRSSSATLHAWAMQPPGVRRPFASASAS